MKLWLVFFAPATSHLTGAIIRAETREQALAHARVQASAETLNEPDYAIKEVPVDGTPGVVEGLLA